ncbi:amidohydrolase family protein [Chloroflexota bacterium]
MERIELYLDMWRDRFWTEQGGDPPFGAPYGKTFKELFNKIYFDTVGFEERMNTVMCALTTISPERLAFGTDYPFNFNSNPKGVRKYIDNIRSLELSAESIEAILGGNAAQLLGLQ